jgi:hypothetical protein
MLDENKHSAESSRNGMDKFVNGRREAEPIQEEGIDDKSLADNSGSLFSNHGGKLAVGVAAMLGLAIFYKWREQEVSHEDPDESAGLKKIKEMVESDRPLLPLAHDGREEVRQ